MAQYVNFKKCTICRTDLMRKTFRTKFNVTLLLNLMYLSIMQQINSLKGTGLSANDIYDKIMEIDEQIVDSKDNFKNCENPKDEIVRQIRNALAHFNIITSLDSYNSIDKVILFSEDKGYTCEEYEYIEIDPMSPSDKHPKKIICKFTFTIYQLERLVDFILHKTSVEFGSCDSCPYKGMEEKQCQN